MYLSLNTILNKLQDLQCVENCDDPDSSSHHFFEQPVWQTINMFIGESFCLLFFYLNEKYKNTSATSSSTTTSAYESIPNVEVQVEVEGNNITDNSATESTPLNTNGHNDDDTLVPLEGWSLFLLWIPTLCDMTATSLMNIGLLFISASIYQMVTFCSCPSISYI